MQIFLVVINGLRYKLRLDFDEIVENLPWYYFQDCYELENICKTSP
jgi:hypothetical protein